MDVCTHRLPRLGSYNLILKMGFLMLRRNHVGDTVGVTGSNPVSRTTAFIFSVRIDCDGWRTFIYQHLSEFTQERAAVTPTTVLSH